MFTRMEGGREEGRKGIGERGKVEEKEEGIEGKVQK